MSDLQHSTSDGASGAPTPASAASANGSASGSGSKRRVAATTINGSHVHVVFSEAVGGGEVKVDVKQIPGAGSISGTALNVLVSGVVGLIQGAYSNVDRGHAATSQKIVQRLLGGEWTPGRPRAAEKEPDELVAALAEHLKKTPAEVEEQFLPRYADNHSVKIPQARRMLRQHKDVAPIIARIVAERAKATAEAVKRGGSQKENLAALL